MYAIKRLLSGNNCLTTPAEFIDTEVSVAIYIIRIFIPMSLLFAVPSASVQHAST